MEESFGLAVSPNPFRDEAIVTLALGRPAEVEAALYDVLGRRVVLLASGTYLAGRHTLALDGARLPSGVYVVRAVMEWEGGARTFTQRVTLMR
jgi:hypothetical protein